MIYLDDKADTCPNGLQGTPFWEVYRALRQVAVAGAWPVDPGAYRAGMAWGWYALHKPEYLTNFRNVVQAALISACAPMIKPTQADAELVEYLRQWREYRPTFPQLQSLYSLFGAVVDVQSISDPESQAVLPVDDTRLAFYLRVESVDPERPLSLSDAITIAVRATPIGSRPYAYYVQESRVTVPVALAPSGVTVWVENDTVASDPPTPPAPALPTVSTSGDFNDQNNKFSFATTHIDKTVFPNGTCIMYEWGTQQYKEYDTTKGYAVWSYSLLNGSLVGRTGFSVEPFTSGGQTIIQCLNSTSENITASYCFVAVCSSSSATVITVYDSSNTPYNAFKYTSDGTDYYYVLDGTQTDWTDDLASIGYKLPTIGYVGSDKAEISMNAGDMETLYDENGTKMTVSTYGISYPAVRVYSSSSDTTGTAVVNNNWTVHGPRFSNGDLSVSNLTGSRQTIQRIAFIK